MRKRLIGIAIGAGATLLALVAAALPLGRSLNNRLYDLSLRRTATPEAAPRNIVIVEINETSLRQLEPVVGRWPWPRLVHATLVDFLARAPARVVAYDVLFTDSDRRTGFDVGGATWTGAESDEALAQSVKQSGNVIMLADVTYEGVERRAVNGAAPGVRRAAYRLDDAIEARPTLVPPIQPLAAAAAAVGHNLRVLDEDGPVRWTAPFVRTPDGVLPSLGVAAMLAARGIGPDRVTSDADGVNLGRLHVPLERLTLPRLEGEPARTGRRLRIRYRGPALLPDGRPLYRTFSFYDLFYSEEQILAGERPHVDPATFRDAIVFVGTTASGLHDTFATPMGATGKMAGPQIHANVADALLSARFIRRVPVAAVALVSLLASVVVSVLVGALPMRWSLPAAGVIAMSVVAAALTLFRGGWWLALVEPVSGVAVAAFAMLGYQYFVEGREKRAVKALFSRYVSRDVFDQVMANPSLAELGGKRRDMSVLFSDVRGFTALTEGDQPEALVAQLNEYFSRMVEVVFRHRGTLDKFVGDMVMALFGAPLDDAAHADHAVGAALDMVRELEALNRKWAAEGRPTLGIGIGISSGEMIAGNIGAETVRSYTVIGDTVNLGSRLESLNKEKGTTIIVSAETARRLTQPFDLRPLGVVTVRGKTVPVEIFEVRGPAAAGNRANHAQTTAGSAGL